MSENNESSNSGWKILFALGYLSIFMGGMKFITTVKIPLEIQPFIAIISSILWFASSSLFQWIPDETGKIKLVRYYALGAGLIQIACAIWMLITSKAHVDLSLIRFNLLFAIFSITTLYGATLRYFFPKLHSITTPTPPDPLEEYPQSIQEIINKGRYWVNAPPGITIFVFFIIAVIGNTINAVKLHDESSNFFFIVIGVGFLLTFTIGIIATFKWQKWARRSGIPEEELRAAAKEVNLWWPNTKVK